MSQPRYHHNMCYAMMYILIKKIYVYKSNFILSCIFLSLVEYGHSNVLDRRVGVQTPECEKYNNSILSKGIDVIISQLYQLQGLQSDEQLPLYVQNENNGISKMRFMW